MRLQRKVLKINETVVTVISEEKYIPLAEREIFLQRSILEDYIRTDPGFLFSLEPREVPREAPPIVRKMAKAAKKAGVGPMAGVAGAIAEFTLKAMIEEGARHVILDNGGDIAMYISEPVTVGIYTGRKESSGFGLLFEPSDGIIGICTSSGTLGHSISFGKADAAVVISRDVTLADTVATALGNRISVEDEDAIGRAMESLMFSGIEGMMVFIGNLIGMAGNLPRIVKVDIDPEVITKG